MNTAKLRVVSENPQEELFYKMRDVFVEASLRLNKEELQQLCLSVMENSIANIIGNAVHSNVPNEFEDQVDEAVSLIERGIESGYMRGHQEFDTEHHEVFVEVKAHVCKLKGQEN